MIVAHWVGIEEDGTGGYSMHYATDTMPRHSVLGMLTMGAQLLDEDDD